MKKHIYLLLTLLLIVACRKEVCAQNHILGFSENGYHIDYIQQSNIYLNMTSSQCILRATGDTNTVSVSANMSVYRLENGNFVLQKTWIGSGKQSLRMSNSYSASGGAYKLVATVTSTSKNRAQETVTKTQYFNL